MNTEPEHEQRTIRWGRFLRSVRTKYTVTLLTVVLIPLSIYTVVEIRRLQQALEETGLKTLEASARYRATIIDSFLERGLDQALTIANLPTLIRYLEPGESPFEGDIEDIRSNLRSLKLVNQVFISSVAILDTDGWNRVDTSRANEDKWEGDQNYFSQPLLTGTPEVSLIKSAPGEIEGLFFSSVIYSDGYPLGILRIQYSPQVLSHLLIQESSLSSSASTPVLFDEDGNILGGGIRGYETSRPRTQRNETSVEEPGVYGTYGINTNSPPGIIVTASSSGDVERWALSRTRLRFADWNLAYVQPYWDFVAPARRQMRLAFISGVTVVFVIVGFGLTSAYFLVAPLRRLQIAASKIAHGDLEARVEITTHDEIGEVGQTFNEMAQRLSQREAALTEAKVRAEEANKAKSQFLAVMSHEIRTPLNSIIGFGTLLSESESLTEQQSRDVNRITRASHNLLKLINDILDFSKIEAGRLKLNWRMVSLERVLGQVTELILPSLANKPVEFFVHVEEDVPREILSDEQRLIQVLANLLTNAAKFTERGSINLSLSMYDDGAEICMRVTDTGLGISEEVRDKLFRAFSQGDSSNTRKHGGTGLGLVICRRISNALGGNVSIDPEVEIGTSLELSLPVRKQSEEKLSPPPRETSTDQTVVVLGRNDESLSYHREILFANGLNQTTIAMDPDFDFRAKPDLTIIDLDNGFCAEDLSELQIDNLERALTQRVLILSNASGAALLEFETNEEVRRIPKPLLPSELTGVVLDMLDDRHNAGRNESLRDASAVPRVVPEFSALVIEDDLMSGELMRKILHDMGATVTLENNATSAIDRTQETEFDIIITDIHMSGMDGLAFVDFLRGSLSRIPPIIVTTADVSENTRNRALFSGISELIYKPINTTKFVALIESSLRVK